MERFFMKLSKMTSSKLSNLDGSFVCIVMFLGFKDFVHSPATENKCPKGCSI